jgi:hypothetical protein
MHELATVLCVAGILAMLIGGLMVLVTAFGAGIRWGLVCLVVPFGKLLFVVTHWQDAKTWFLTYVAGIALAIAGFHGLDRDRDVQVPSETRSTAGADSSARAPERAASRAPEIEQRPASRPAVDPLRDQPVVLSTQPSQDTPRELLPRREPAAPRTHVAVAPADLARHVGVTLRFRLKNGKTIVGRMLGVENDAVRIERDMGLGSSSFRVPLADIEEILKRI